MAIITIEYEKGDEVKLPFNEEGEIVGIQQLPWIKKYDIGITVSNGFNAVGTVVDYFARDIELK